MESTLVGGLGGGVGAEEPGLNSCYVRRETHIPEYLE